MFGHRLSSIILLLAVKIPIALSLMAKRDLDPNNFYYDCYQNTNDETPIDARIDDCRVALDQYPTGEHNLHSLGSSSNGESPLYTPTFLFSKYHICAWRIFLQDSSTPVDVTKEDLAIAADSLYSTCEEYGSYGVVDTGNGIWLQSSTTEDANGNFSAVGGTSFPANWMVTGHYQLPKHNPMTFSQFSRFRNASMDAIPGLVLGQPPQPHLQPHLIPVDSPSQ